MAPRKRAPPPLLTLDQKLFDRIMKEYMNTENEKQFWRNRAVCRTFYDTITQHCFKSPPQPLWKTIQKVHLVDFLQYWSRQDYVPSKLDPIITFIDAAAEKFSCFKLHPPATKRQLREWIIQALVYTENGRRFEWIRTHSPLQGQIQPEVVLAVAAAVGCTDVVDRLISQSVGILASNKNGPWSATVPLGCAIQAAAATGKTYLLSTLLRSLLPLPTEFESRTQIEYTLCQAIDSAIRSGQPGTAESSSLVALFNFWHNEGVGMYHKISWFDWEMWFDAAVQASNLEVLKKLLHLANFRSDRHPILHLAAQSCRYGRDTFIRHLLDTDKVSSNDTYTFSGYYGELSGSLLWFTVQSQDCRTARILLNNGADVDADGGYILGEAIKRGRADTVRLLVDHGCKVTSKLVQCAEGAGIYGLKPTDNQLQENQSRGRRKRRKLNYDESTE
ncbi:hypothetical protein P154DRAFT_579995 [Amniculicola lignicola CBS 123094]|uniref:Ankyrin n=1 Tax=Amniculicola lignicola CBS 123094 TaxID=1392246 RepID=A0A6A5W6G5_9PLEO|nr:hypothetical protein P154DRAFT_579995 [Amniculicola lignicola CBS 123094]